MLCKYLRRLSHRCLCFVKVNFIENWNFSWCGYIDSFAASVTFGARYSRIDQVKFVEDSLYNIWIDMVCLNFTWFILEYLDPFQCPRKYKKTLRFLDVSGQYKTRQNYNFTLEVGKSYVVDKCLFQGSTNLILHGFCARKIPCA